MFDQNNEEIAAQAHSRGKSLFLEFKARMDDLVNNEGLVDCKMKLAVSEDTTPADVVRTLSNVLRLRAEGKCQPLRVDPYKLG
jgi:hypothetical protein